MTKAESIGRWLAENPRPAKAIAGIVLLGLILVAAAGLWHGLTQAKPFRIIVPVAIAAIYGFRTYRKSGRMKRVKQHQPL